MNDSKDSGQAAARPAWIDDLFAAIDQRDPGVFVSFLTEDASFRFGNAPAVSGRAAIAEAVGQFFAGIAGLSHRVTEVATRPGLTFCRGDVTYTRLDHSQITLPFADVFEMEGDRISSYQIYMDVTPLFSPPDD